MTVSDGLQKLTLSPKIRAVKSAAKTVFKLQWRTVFLTIEMLLTFIFVWVFYMTQLSKIDMSISSSWFLQWVKKKRGGGGEEYGDQKTLKSLI